MLTTFGRWPRVTVTIPVRGAPTPERDPLLLTASAPRTSTSAGQHMGILSRLFGGGTDKATTAPEPATSPNFFTPAGQPVRLRPSRRGKPLVRYDLHASLTVEVSGYRYVYADTGMAVRTSTVSPSCVGADWSRWLSEHGAVSCNAVGLAYVEGDLVQSDGLSPSRRLALVRHPENPHDANAVSITLQDGRHVGWVPRGRARKVAPRLDAGEQLAAVVIDQTRDSQGRRVAYSVLIGDPAWLDELFARARPWRE